MSSNGAPTSSSARISALSTISVTPARNVLKKTTADGRELPISEYFGELTFGLAQMREKLQKDAFGNLMQCLEKGTRLSAETADSIAQVIKEWAVMKGATHFCHWFQPMTGLTAEKHDSFLSIQQTNYSEISVVERFSGSQLIQGEPDASSFPSGGMRSTFEARGYTAWDPSSPIFIIDSVSGRTLCIPSVFIGYHGEALDLKTPLLRSQEVLSRKSCEFLKLLGDVDTKAVIPTIGAEQEYFLIDKRLACLRPDLIMCGRTVLGAPPPRGQQLEDHYFGAIPSRVKTFMADLEQELYRLGVPVKTRHNEVAPSQFELAPIFEDANISADHNTLVMETLKRIANRHDFMCLLHEKPFAELNGSGKHCNWSLRNDKGENLLEPGKTPHQNLRFLAVLAVVLKAVQDHAAIMRASIASPGNDHRLGANEAPPAIISVFLGSMLTDILDTIEKGNVAQATEAEIINLDVGAIPDVSKDYTDRNRTSPFAFTGNKFEFRAVGSSANVSVPTTVLNAAVADAFDQANEKLTKLISEKSSRDEAVMELVREFVTLSKNVRFEGNNYSDEWKQEAEARGLPMLESTVEALKVFQDKGATAFLVNHKVLTEDEIESRFNVATERYVKSLLIELEIMGELVATHIIPCVETQVIKSQKALDDAVSSSFKERQKDRVIYVEGLLESLLAGREDLIAVMSKLEKVEGEEEKMAMLKATAIPVANALRAASDKAEVFVEDGLWPLPKYREMLFTNSI